MPETATRTADPGALPLSRDDVGRACRRLDGRVVATPVVRSDELDRLTGSRLWLKAENLQRGGSFKVRGALLAVDRLTAAGCRGLVAQSTGNHGIAVALAARAHGMPAVVVLPEDAAAAKVRKLREAGAEVIHAGRLLAERVAAVEDIRTRRGFAVVDPYEDPDVVAGQGSASAELIAQAAEAGTRLDALVVPVGGGSAVAGACLAADGSGTEVFGAEPEAVPALTEALRAGAPVTVPARATIADGLRPDRIGRLPFTIAAGRITAVEVVGEAAIADALRLALLRTRMLVEPAAATALAVASRLPAGRYRDVGVLLTGGNVDASLVAAVLSRADQAPGATA